MSKRSDLWVWLDAAHQRGVMPGLERMERLLDSLGNPEKQLTCLHVAGTNGKGSVCAFTEAILRTMGKRTGFYSSPHLVDFAERIRIDGFPASHVKIEEGIARLKSACDEWSECELPTYFELVTALAFDLFARARCDIVVLETGLGGRLDATNTAPKIACAITPISLDHTEYLGESLAEIAREKAGIMRSNIPVVLAPQEPEAAKELLHFAQEVDALPVWVTKPISEAVKLGLSGSYQQWNAALALELIRVAGFNPSDDEIRSGLAGVVWPGRFQKSRNGSLILDGAHNLHAAKQLVSTWREEFGDQKCHLIFGALADKNPRAMLSILESIADEIFLVPVSSPRSWNFEQEQLRFFTQYRICGSLQEGLKKAFESFPKNRDASQTPVLLVGSLFLVGEALALDSGEDFIPRRQ